MSGLHRLTLHIKFGWHNVADTLDFGHFANFIISVDTNNLVLEKQTGLIMNRLHRPRKPTPGKEFSSTEMKKKTDEEHSTTELTLLLSRFY